MPSTPPEHLVRTATQQASVVVISRDGTTAVELLAFRGTVPVPNRAAIAYKYLARITPRAAPGPLEVRFSLTATALSPSDCGLPSSGNREIDFLNLAQAAVGEALDARGTSAFATVAEDAIPQTECFSPQFDAWRHRLPSKDLDIEAYLRARLYWAWRFGHDAVTFGAADCIRFRVEPADFTRLARLGEGVEWDIHPSAPGTVVLTPNSALLRAERAVREAPAPADWSRATSPATPNESARSNARQPSAGATAVHVHDDDGAADVFISHASEDKATVAHSIAERLIAAGYRVWFDAMTLRLGDSIAQEIDRGLAGCRYGVVILSPAFFRKEWPRRELDGLVARETAERSTRILPVWHGVDHAAVARYSPMLAGKFAISTDEGAERIVAHIRARLDAPERRFAGDVNQPATLQPATIASTTVARPPEHHAPAHLSAAPLALGEFEDIEQDRTAAQWRTAARLAGSSTYVTERQLSTLFSQYQPARVLLAARPDDLNGAALTVLVYDRTGNVYVADRSLLNIARAPRIAEVRAILHALSAASIPDVRYATTMATETVNLSPVEAVRRLEALSSAALTGREAMQEFAQLLGANSAVVDELNNA